MSKGTKVRTADELEAEAEKERAAAAEAEAEAEAERAAKEEARRDEVEAVAAAIATVERDTPTEPGAPLSVQFFPAARAALDALDELRSGSKRKKGDD